jgi:hypothetical protein
MTKKTTSSVNSAGADKKRTAGRRRMTAPDEQQIAKFVRAWPAVPMTWDLIVAKIERVVGKAPADADGKKSNVVAGGLVETGYLSSPGHQKGLRCETAQGLDADRRAKPLKSLSLGGAIQGADSHPVFNREEFMTAIYRKAVFEEAGLL